MIHYFSCANIPISQPELKVCISNKISLKFVPKGPINIPALFHMMAWRQPDNKPLSEPMMA